MRGLVVAWLRRASLRANRSKRGGAALDLYMGQYANGSGLGRSAVAVPGVKGGGFLPCLAGLVGARSRAGVGVLGVSPESPGRRKRKGSEPVSLRIYAGIEAYSVEVAEPGFSLAENSPRF